MSGIGWALFWFGVGTFSAWAAAFPGRAFRIFEAWKFKNPDKVELSDGVLAYRTLLYVAGVIVGFGLGFAALLQQ